MGTSPFNAIEFSNFPMLCVNGDADFSDETRGIHVLGGAKFDVDAGKTLRLANPVTYSGALLKTGEGVLELAGTARFIDGKADTEPVVETNVLQIAAGALKVSSKTAADGLAISFTSERRLIVPSDSAGGLYDVKWDAPIATEEADGKVRVVVELAAADASKSRLEVPICTVNPTAAATLPVDKFVVARPGNGLKCIGVEKRSADGNVAYVATFVHQGLKILFK